MDIEWGALVLSGCAFAGSATVWFVVRRHGAELDRRRSLAFGDHGPAQFGPVSTAVTAVGFALFGLLLAAIGLGFVPA